MEEIWKNVTEEGYENLYEVSNLGRVRRIGKKNGKCLKPYPNKKGYLQVDLTNNGKRKCCRIHRLVAKAFIPNPNNLEEVNHKDENKTNNMVTNLEWCTSEYNANYKTRNKRIRATKEENNFWLNRKHSDTSKDKMSVAKIGKNKNKKIYCEGRQPFNSCKECALFFGISPKNLSDCLVGRRKMIKRLQHLNLHYID